MRIIKLFLSVVTLVMCGQISADNGPGGSGGGNAYEAEFKAIGLQLHLQMVIHQLTDAQAGFSIKDFGAEVVKVDVKGTDDPTAVTVDGESRMAKNTPRINRIQFLNSWWQNLTDLQKPRLVLHEYLRFLGVDDHDYRVSIPLIAKLTVGATKAFHIDCVLEVGQGDLLSPKTLKPSLTAREAQNAIFELANPKTGQLYQFVLTWYDFTPDFPQGALGLDINTGKQRDGGGYLVEHLGTWESSADVVGLLFSVAAQNFKGDEQAVVSVTCSKNLNK